MSRRIGIAVIPGDGIGREVVPIAIDVLDAVGRHFDFSFLWTEFDWGSEHYRRHGRMMPEDALATLRQHEAILFGAVGAPDVPDHISLWGLLIPIRRGFDQYVNLRPARHVPGVPSPLVHPEGTDLVIVRENVEGEYSELGGRFGRGTEAEFTVQDAVFTRLGVRRVARYAVDLAGCRRGQLTSATKSNGIVHTMPFWDEIVAEVVAAHPARVTLRSVLVDALAAELVRRPQAFDVIVASNLLGDILSDLTAACVGSLGLAASANINPEREHPSLFEPVHGSAPDIAGQGVANPLAQVSAAAMMIRHLGEAEAALAVETAVDTVLREGVHTPDLGGKARTKDVAQALLDAI